MKSLFRRVRKLASSTIWLDRLTHSVKLSGGAKVKLVAIARNESAYLAEWLYHHLYFGFESIEVHVNNCTDDTAAVIDAINHPGITCINADALFSSATNSPQIEVYRAAFFTAKAEGFTHLMFLDIDEFWVPSNLTDTISKWAQKNSFFDIQCFSWLNKVDEQHAFARVIEDGAVQVAPAQQVKSLYKTYIVPSTMNPHNVIDTSYRYCRDDGESFTPLNTHYSRVAPLSFPFSGDRAFIIHRMFRSQKEYISLLGRGRPVGKNNKASIFKDNRHGYITVSDAVTVRFDKHAWDNYRDFMESRLSESAVAQTVQRGQQFVLSEYQRVVEQIRNAPANEQRTLAKLLANLDDESLVAAYTQYKNKHQG